MTATALEGIRVIDLTRMLPGGFCTLLLADLGADVIKVEDTGAGDYVRWAPPFREEGEPSARSSLFVAINHNKRSIRVDLKSSQGREVLLRLVRGADVVVESFRPGVMDRLGVGYEVLARENPRLVYCALSGYGQDGPYRSRAGHDLNFVGLTGLLALSGEADGPPVQSAAQIGDVGGGSLMAAVGVLAALRERDRSGRGQLVDAAIVDGTLSWTMLHAARQLAEEGAVRRGDVDLGGALVCYRPYPCRDGWVTFAALEQKFWRRWCHGVGRDDLVEHQFARAGSEVHEQVSAIFLARTRDGWEAFNAEHDCCVEPVLELSEALNSPLARERGMLVEVAQPGVGTLERLGVPVKLSRTPGDPARRPAPALGEHTEDVLREAGLSDEEIDALVEAGAVGRLEEGVQGRFMEL